MNTQTIISPDNVITCVPNASIGKAPEFQSSVTFHDKDKGEMLRIAPDGFYVRGIKLDVDEHEGKQVYEGLKVWLKSMSLM